MSSLAGTKWVIWHPHPNGITFNTDGTCIYGPYHGTFTEDGDNFHAEIDCMPGDPNYQYTEFKGSHEDGRGSGTMTTVWRLPNPPGPGPTPFTMTKAAN